MPGDEKGPKSPRPKVNHKELLTLVEFFSQSPLRGANIDLSRPLEYCQDVDFGDDSGEDADPAPPPPPSTLA